MAPAIASNMMKRVAFLSSSLHRLHVQPGSSVGAPFQAVRFRVGMIRAQQQHRAGLLFGSGPEAVFGA